MNYDLIYEYRFRGITKDEKQKVWTEISRYLYRRMGCPQTVLDPAAGFCEFINSVPASEKWALDQNLTFLEQHAAPGIHTIGGNCLLAELPEEYFDAVFVSNFLEHLRDVEEIVVFFSKVQQWLKEGGLFVVMGPNFKYCSKEYFDCCDHRVILTNISVCELGIGSGFQIESSHEKFLPYSFRSRLPARDFLVKSYLNLPIFWRILGKQFLIIFRKS